MPTPQAVAYANSNTWVGAAIETSGPAAAPAFWIPVITPKLGPKITQLKDYSVRGGMSESWGMKQGPRHDELNFKFLCQLDVLPSVMRSVLGSVDTVGPVNNLWSHTLSLLNTGNGQPPTYSWFDYDGRTVRQMSGGVTDRVTLTWKADGLCEVAVRVLGQPFTVAGISTANIISNQPPTTGWDSTLTFNSQAKTTLMASTVIWDRKCTVIDTMDGFTNQGPYSIFASPLATFIEAEVINTDDTELTAYTTGNQVPYNLAFQNTSAPGASMVLDFQTSKVSVGGQQRGQKGIITTLIQVASFPNTLDESGTGTSPSRVTITNSQSSAY